MAIRRVTRGAWGNALGGWKRQARDARGRFASRGAKKKAAKKRYKASRKRARTAHRNIMKGSAKARVREIPRYDTPRAKKVVLGTGTYAAGRAIGSNRLQSQGSYLVGSGLKASKGRAQATRAMSRGLKKHRYRQAKSQYRREIGSTPAKRAAKAGIVAAGAVGMGYAAYRRGNIQMIDDNRTMRIGARPGSPGRRIQVTPTISRKRAHIGIYTAKGVAGEHWMFREAGLDAHKVWTNYQGVLKKGGEYQFVPGKTKTWKNRIW